MSAACLVDSHAHLDMPRFDADREDVIRRARLADVANIISVGTDLISSRKAIEIASQHSEVLAAVGIHPRKPGMLAIRIWTSSPSLHKSQK